MEGEAECAQSPKYVWDFWHFKLALHASFQCAMPAFCTRICLWSIWNSWLYVFDAVLPTIVMKYSLEFASIVCAQSLDCFNIKSIVKGIPAFLGCLIHHWMDSWPICCLISCGQEVSFMFVCGRSWSQQITVDFLTKNSCCGCLTLLKYPDKMQMLHRRRKMPTFCFPDWCM